MFNSSESSESNFKKLGQNVYLLFKGIVSRDFEVCFLIPLDSSDIATPDGTGSFFKSQFRVKFSIIRSLAVVPVVFAVSESRLTERPQLFS
jgi:hypothetical protein